MSGPNPDCASRNRPHGPHTLFGPGGNKPGSHCAGLPEPDERQIVPAVSATDGAAKVSDKLNWTIDQNHQLQAEVERLRKAVIEVPPRLAGLMADLGGELQKEREWIADFIPLVERVQDERDRLKAVLTKALALADRACICDECEAYRDDLRAALSSTDPATEANEVDRYHQANCVTTPDTRCTCPDPEATS
ncbi:hypothetical protein [Aeromicrobium sp. 9AM]|uniref:hypothetical protein n=1 Tax=Aeromicrobium sp. 9AM TaxID=2653126 RepID=UPI0012F3D3BA|nr:hypothetical protein [Aeromicrobium sp. 9AM]VXC07019.1 hypothetical protein AERO9AM_30602 [Aeromicrobium sp. 9AM]